MNFEQLPTDLFRFGFKTKPTSPVEPLLKDRVEKIAGWISTRFDKGDKLYKSASSYGIKHFIEREMGEYVSTGEVIAAFITLGFKYEQDGPNAYFFISKIAVSDNVK